jgi:hypothetical protein
MATVHGERPVVPLPCHKRQFYSGANAAYALLVQEIATNSIMTEVSAFHGG